MLTLEQVAREWMFSKRTISRWAVKGRLPAVVVNGVHLFRRADIEATFVRRPGVEPDDR